MDKRAEKSSPFGPKGEASGLRYSRLAVGGLQLRLELPCPRTSPFGAMSGISPYPARMASSG